MFLLVTSWWRSPWVNPAPVNFRGKVLRPAFPGEGGGRPWLSDVSPHRFFPCMFPAPLNLYKYTLSQILFSPKYCLSCYMDHSATCLYHLMCLREFNLLLVPSRDFNLLNPISQMGQVWVNLITPSLMTSRSFPPLFFKGTKHVYCEKGHEFEKSIHLIYK